MNTVLIAAFSAFLSTVSAHPEPTAPTSGSYLSETPSAVPGSTQRFEEASLTAGIKAHRAGQEMLAIETLTRWLDGREGPWGEQRANGRFLLAWLLKNTGRYNEASRQFSIVRNSDVPLTEEASWWEAWTDLQRGRYLVSARECLQYRQNWPYGEHHGECLLLMADAYKSAGHNRTARETYSLWLDENPASPIRDRVQLDLAVLEAMNGWARGYRHLADLMLNSRDLDTASRAHGELVRQLGNGSANVALTPLSVAKGVIESLIQRGDVAAAWELFLQSGGSEGSSPIGRWSPEERIRLSWRTRQYDHYVEYQMENYLQTPTGEVGWKIFRGYQKGGRFLLAAEWGERMIDSHPRHRRWRRTHDQLAQMWQLHGDYSKAREHWEILSQRRGRIGRAGRWYVAWTTFRLGELEQAEALFTEIAESGVEQRLGASYYLGRVHQEAGRSERAFEHYTATSQESPHNWYGELARLRIQQINEGTQAISNNHRGADGSWRANQSERLSLSLVENPHLQASSQFTRHSLATNGVISTGAPPQAQEIDWSTIREPRTPYQYPQTLDSTGANSSSSPDIPNSYKNNPYFDEQAASETFDRFVSDNEDIWDQLPAIKSLASIGLYELSGPMMEAIRIEHRGARREEGPRAAIVRNARVSGEIWRDVSRHCRDHNTVARSAIQPSEEIYIVENDDLEALWLNFPTAHIDALMTQGEIFGVDPMLGLSLMRQESLYSATAESRVGANGLMQVMPITGIRIATSLGEPFSPNLLAQPDTNIRYGTWYLSKLIERFDGSWPVALAAYNAGPMNTSSWLQPWIGEIDIDDFVEQIPFRETREYVKGVLGYYSIHLALYSPPSAVDLSFATGHDHPEVIDY